MKSSTSSSPQNTMSDRHKSLSRLNDSIHTCPDCGNRAMVRVRGDCLLQDGTLVADLERWQCTECRANFFDSKAMEAIRRVRRAHASVGMTT